jgi:hypothetical protein
LGSPPSPVPPASAGHSGGDQRCHLTDPADRCAATACVTVQTPGYTSGRGPDSGPLPRSLPARPRQRRLGEMLS